MGCGGYPALALLCSYVATSKQPLGLEQFEKFERRTDKIDKIAKYSTVEEVPIFSSIKIINTGKVFFKN